MTNRGRVSRDENPSSIPVAELLAAHKRVRQVEAESGIPVGALLRRERALSPDGPADHAAQRTGSRRRWVPQLLGLASAAAVLAGALVTAQLVTGYEPPPGSDGSVPENIIAPKVPRPGVIPGSGDDGTTAADQDSSAEDGAGGGANDADTGSVASGRAAHPTRHAGAGPHSPTRQNPPAPSRPPAQSSPVTPTRAKPTKPQPTATPTATTTTTTSTTAG